MLIRLSLQLSLRYILLIWMFFSCKTHASPPRQDSVFDLSFPATSESFVTNQFIEFIYEPSGSTPISKMSWSEHSGWGQLLRYREKKPEIAELYAQWSNTGWVLELCLPPAAASEIVGPVTLEWINHHHYRIYPTQATGSLSIPLAKGQSLLMADSGTLHFGSQDIHLPEDDFKTKRREGLIWSEIAPSAGQQYNKTSWILIQYNMPQLATQKRLPINETEVPFWSEPHRFATAGKITSLPLAKLNMGRGPIIRDLPLPLVQTILTESSVGVVDILSRLLQNDPVVMAGPLHTIRHYHQALFFESEPVEAGGRGHSRSSSNRADGSSQGRKRKGKKEQPPSEKKRKMNAGDGAASGEGQGGGSLTHISKISTDKITTRLLLDLAWELHQKVEIIRSFFKQPGVLPNHILASLKRKKEFTGNLFHATYLQFSKLVQFHKLDAIYHLAQIFDGNDLLINALEKVVNASHEVWVSEAGEYNYLYQEMVKRKYTPDLKNQNLVALHLDFSFDKDCFSPNFFNDFQLHHPRYLLAEFLPRVKVGLERTGNDEVYRKIQDLLLQARKEEQEQPAIEKQPSLLNPSPVSWMVPALIEQEKTIPLELMYMIIQYIPLESLENFFSACKCFHSYSGLFLHSMDPRFTKFAGTSYQYQEKQRSRLSNSFLYHNRKYLLQALIEPCLLKRCMMDVYLAHEIIREKRGIVCSSNSGAKKIISRVDPDSHFINYFVVMFKTIKVGAIENGKIKDIPDLKMDCRRNKQWLGSGEYNKPVFDGTILDDANQLATISQKEINIWDLRCRETQRVQQTIYDQRKTLLGITVIKNTKHCDDLRIVLLRSYSGKTKDRNITLYELAILARDDKNNFNEVSKTAVECEQSILATSPQKNTVLSFGVNKDLRLWKINGKELSSVHCKKIDTDPTDKITGIDLSDEMIIIARKSGSLLIMDFNMREVSHGKPFDSKIHAISLFPNNTLAIASGDNIFIMAMRGKELSLVKKLNNISTLCLRYKVEFWNNFKIMRHISYMKALTEELLLIRDANNNVYSLYVPWSLPDD